MRLYQPFCPAASNCFQQKAIGMVNNAGTIKIKSISDIVLLCFFYNDWMSYLLLSLEQILHAEYADFPYEKLCSGDGANGKALAVEGFVSEGDFICG